MQVQKQRARSWPFSKNANSFYHASLAYQDYIHHRHSDENYNSRIYLNIGTRLSRILNGPNFNEIFYEQSSTNGKLVMLFHC